MLKIVQAPNLVLSKKSRPVGKIDKSIKKLLKEMEQTLDNAKDPEGVGLAAPQVGRAMQIFVVRQNPETTLMTFINPKIEDVIDKKPEAKKKKTGKITQEKGVQLEGCLSLYSIWGVVKRHHGVVLSYQDEHGTQHKKTFEGFLATIIQHECDHLQGILFPKRVLEQENPLYRSVKNEKGETEFEEIEI